MAQGETGFGVATPYGESYSDVDYYMDVFKKKAERNDATRREIIGDSLEAATELLNAECGRDFWAHEEEARIFYPLRVESRRLKIDDMRSIPTLVEIDYYGTDSWSTIEANQFILTEPGKKNYPFTDIVLRPSRSVGGGAGYSHSGWGFQARVTAEWGWSKTPRAIRRACCEMAAIDLLESPRSAGQLGAAMSGTQPVSHQASHIIERMRLRFKRMDNL